MNANKWILAALLIGSMAACKKDDDDDDSGLNDTDRTFMTNVSFGNHAEIAAGNTAASKGTLAIVRTFGTMMVADHTQAQTELGAVASQTGMTALPSTPDSAHIQMNAMLATMSGRAFDSAYMRMQVLDHQNTIALYQNEISNGRDQRVKDFASAKLPAIQMHKHMADSIVAANGF